MTTKRSLSIPKVFIAIAAAVALAAGCGGQQFPQTKAPAPKTPHLTVNTSASPRARLLAAVSRASTFKTARMSISEALSGFNTDDDTSPSSLSIAGGGGMDLANKRMDLKLEVNSDGDVQQFEVRVVGQTSYLGHDGDWTSEPSSGFDAETPAPNSYLDYLRGVSAHVTIEGHEKLHGDDTTRYGASIDPIEALSKATNATQKSTLEHAVDVFGAAKIPVTVWIDDLGRLRKIRMSFDLSGVAFKLGTTPGSHPKIDLTMELYDFGVAVDVQTPANVRSQASLAQDRSAQSDLRNALTAEKTLYTDSETYSDDTSSLAQIESTLDWGGKLSVVVGAAVGEPEQVVCLSEPSASGRVFSIADVAAGPNAGTYFAKAGCPAVATDQIAHTFGSSW